MDEDVNKDKFISEVTQLTDLVPYQDSAVVSHSIVDKDSGTITLFAFDKGQGLSEHKTPFDALIYLLDGEASVTISGRLFKLKKGQIITIPANNPHTVKAIEKFKMLLVMIRL
jgi:quercetin dioxygenase-like cupin family protein